MEQITSIEGENMDPIDPSVAISFVILVDKTTIPSSRPLSPKVLPDFRAFHEFFLDLEDRLLDGCDEYWDGIDDEVEEESGGYSEESPSGCQITVAAFHPQWQFGHDGNTAEDGTEQSFEKRAPYPCLSIVMSTAIDALMNERANIDVDIGDKSVTASGSEVLSAPATERIAALNEKILGDIGVERLEQIFEDNVVQCPMNRGE